MFLTRTKLLFAGPILLFGSSRAMEAIHEDQKVELSNISDHSDSILHLDPAKADGPHDLEAQDPEVHKIQSGFWTCKCLCNSYGCKKGKEDLRSCLSRFKGGCSACAKGAVDFVKRLPGIKQCLKSKTELDPADEDKNVQILEPREGYDGGASDLELSLGDHPDEMTRIRCEFWRAGNPDTDSVAEQDDDDPMYADDGSHGTAAPSKKSGSKWFETTAKVLGWVTGIRPAWICLNRVLWSPLKKFCFNYVMCCAGMNGFASDPRITKEQKQREKASERTHMFGNEVLIGKCEINVADAGAPEDWKSAKLVKREFVPVEETLPRLEFWVDYADDRHKIPTNELEPYRVKFKDARKTINEVCKIKISGLPRRSAEFLMERETENQLKLASKREIKDDTDYYRIISMEKLRVIRNPGKIRCLASRLKEDKPSDLRVALAHFFYPTPGKVVPGIVGTNGSSPTEAEVKADNKRRLDYDTQCERLMKRLSTYGQRPPTSFGDELYDEQKENYV